MTPVARDWNPTASFRHSTVLALCQCPLSSACFLTVQHADETVVKALADVKAKHDIPNLKLRHSARTILRAGKQRRAARVCRDLLPHIAVSVDGISPNRSVKPIVTYSAFDTNVLASIFGPGCKLGAVDIRFIHSSLHLGSLLTIA